MSRKLSLYIHVPFCLKKCPYCAFYKRKWQVSLESDYLDALEREAQRMQTWFLSHEEDIYFHTVFIGGGTPNALSTKSFNRLLSIIQNFLLGFSRAPIEQTIELNPEAVTPSYLTIMNDYGYTRASIGIQSFLPEELKVLGRIHTVKTIHQAIDCVQQSHLTTWNMDFMFGFPDSTLEKVQASLDQAMMKSPPHISLYALSIEKGTLYEKHGIQPVPQEVEADQYQFIMSYLKNHGYDHYEVSAFAKPGHQCQHNQTYWNYGEFIGLGPSADSYFNGCHAKNISNLTHYQKKVFHPQFSEKLPLKKAKQTPIATQKIEYLMCNLRLINGFLLSDYQQRFSSDVLDDFFDVFQRFFDESLLVVRKGRLKTTKKGLMVLNTILMAFV